MTDKTFFPLGDGIGRIELIEWIDGDARIVGRAHKCYQSQDKATPEKDAKLLNQVTAGKPMHGTVFRGPVMTFDVVLPLFCMRQWVRHLAGHDYFGEDVWAIGTGDIDLAGAFDEMSVRYVDGRKAAFYVPLVQRMAGAKQHADLAVSEWLRAQGDMLKQYDWLREFGVPKELTRSFLPGHRAFKPRCKMNAFLPPKGEVRLLHTVQITARRFGPVHIVPTHVRTQHGYKQWALLSDRPTSRDTLDEFDLRFDIDVVRLLQP